MISSENTDLCKQSRRLSSSLCLVKYKRQSNLETIFCLVLREKGVRCLADNNVIGQPSGWHPLATAQLLEVTALVSVTCWCVKWKNESYSSGESCICQVYCLIKPIHLSTHWMPIKLHRMVQVYGGLLVPNFITAELSWHSRFHPAKWQAHQSQIKCSWNNAFKEDEMPQPGRRECEM